MRVPATPKYVLTEPERLPRFIHQWIRQRARKKALRQAYLEYRATHTHQAVRFDWYFLTGRGAEALAARDSEALTRAWTTGFCYHDEKQRARDIRLLLPAAESLLELLSAEKNDSA